MVVDDVFRIAAMPSASTPMCLITKLDTLAHQGVP